MALVKVRCKKNRSYNLSSKDKLNLLADKIKVLKSKLPITNVWCDDYDCWKSIEYCYLACSADTSSNGCLFFTLRRWLCIYTNCPKLIRCRSKSFWCDDMLQVKKEVDNYLEMFRQWRRQKALVTAEQMRQITPISKKMKIVVRKKLIATG